MEVARRLIKVAEYGNARDFSNSMLLSALAIRIINSLEIMMLINFRGHMHFVVRHLVESPVSLVAVISKVDNMPLVLCQITILCVKEEKVFALD